MDHSHSTCLNCKHEVAQIYCPNCGQKGDTHRLSFKHFFAHDLLHGLFHLDKGLLFTLKQVLICPGKAALDYIAGKRKAYYSFFYLILLLVGFYTLIGKFNNHYFYHSIVNSEVADSALNRFISDYGKFILFGFVPVVSFNSWLLYRRAKFNYLEHVIVSVLAFLGVIVVFVVDLILEPLELLKIDILNNLLGFLSISSFIFYTCFSFFQAFKRYYTKWGLLWRAAVFLFLVLVELVFFISLIAGFVVGWNGAPIYLKL